MKGNPLRREGLVRRTRPFLVTFAVAAAVALFPYQFASITWVTGGLLGAVAAYGIVLAVPWERLPRWLAVIPSLLFAAVVGSLMAAEGSVNVSLVALLLLPMLWNALHGRAWEMALATLAGAGTILVIAFDFADITSGAIAQPLIVWTAVCSLIAYSIHRLRSDLAVAIDARETMIKQGAAFDLAATELYSTLDPDAVVKVGLQAAAHLILPLEETIKEAFFFVVDGDTASLMGHYNQTSENELPELVFPTADVPMLEEALGQISTCVFDVDDQALGARGATTVRSFGVTNGLAVGIRVDGIRGVLAVASHDRRQFSVAQGEALSSFATILGLALARAVQYAAEATTDALTGLGNRREFNKRLSTIPRNDSYALLSMDVDGLKRLNDKAGHAAGDALLIGVAGALRRSLRGSDVAARIGGDEFCAILHHPTPEQARSVGQRVVAAVREVSAGGIPGSISVGCAVVAIGQDSGERLAAADAAMYKAKRAGGGRVAIADAAPAPVALHEPTKAIAS